MRVDLGLPVHSGGPRAGLTAGGDVCSPRGPRIFRITTASVMKAMILISPPQRGHGMNPTTKVRG